MKFNIWDLGKQKKSSLNIYHKKGKTNEYYVLLHGIFANYLDDYKYLIPELEKRGHNVFTVDLPGHGKSLFKGKITLPMILETIEKVLTEDILNKKVKINIVGYSLGSYVAQCLGYGLMKKGYNVENVVLICGFYYKLNIVSRSIFKVMMNIGGSIPEQLVEKFRNSKLYRTVFQITNLSLKNGIKINDDDFEMNGMPPIEAYKRLAFLFEDVDKLRVVPDDITYKVLNIRAEDDKVSNPSEFKAISKFYKHRCYSVIIPKCGHAVFIEAPEILNSIILKFIGE